MTMCAHNVSFIEVTKQVPGPNENKKTPPKNQELCLMSPIEKIFINIDYSFIQFKSKMEDVLISR